MGGGGNAALFTSGRNRQSLERSMPFDNINIPESTLTTGLRAARDLIDKGWIAGRLNDGRGGYCALGAVNKVFSLKRYPACDLLAHFATYRGLDRCNNVNVTDRSQNTVKIAGHNNMLGREATLDMFDKAIAASIELTMMAE
jgi:hypothetical protein